MLIKRLSYPCRFNDMISRFGRPVPELCMITNPVMDFIYVTHGHRITQWNPAVLNPGFLKRYAAAIAGKGGAPQTTALGLLMARCVLSPNRVSSRGLYIMDALKFQSVAVPNGLIANMDSPVGMFLL